MSWVNEDKTLIANLHALDEDDDHKKELRSNVVVLIRPLWLWTEHKVTVQESNIDNVCFADDNYTKDRRLSGTTVQDDIISKLLTDVESAGLPVLYINSQ